MHIATQRISDMDPMVFDLQVSEQTENTQYYHLNIKPPLRLAALVQSTQIMKPKMGRELEFYPVPHTYINKEQAMKKISLENARYL